jgi:hypothetical protein
MAYNLIKVCSTTTMKQHYIIIFLVLFLICAPILSVAQFGLPAGFELKKFQENENEAFYFLKYDSAYLRVSQYEKIATYKDHICYADKRGWKVIVGTVDSSGFKQTNYYHVDNNGIVTTAKKKFDTIQVAALGRALFNAKKSMQKINNHASSWKIFSKIKIDMTISIIAFPDEDAEGNIWYGPEFVQYYSIDGRQSISSEIVNKDATVASRSKEELNIISTAEKTPPIGIIWLAHRYKLNYNIIKVTYKVGTSSLHFDHATKTYAWEHIAK